LRKWGCLAEIISDDLVPKKIIGFYFIIQKQQSTLQLTHFLLNFKLGHEICITLKQGGWQQRDWFPPYNSLQEFLGS
jgi:hypothetical protein